MHRNKCGMNVSRAMGVEFSDSQVKEPAGWEKDACKRLKRQKGSYDAYLIPEKIKVAYRHRRC